MLTPASATDVVATIVDLPAALAARYIGFVGFLRQNGLHVTTADGADSMDIAERMGQFNAPLLRWSLRALLCSRAEEWRRFDELFDAYFSPPNRQKVVETNAGGAGQLDLEQGDGASGDRSEGAPLATAAGEEGEDGDGTTAQHGASSDASLAQADFRHLNEPAQLQEMDALMRRFAQRLRQIQIRRDRQARTGHRIDMARTIRHSIARGGVPLD